MAVLATGDLTIPKQMLDPWLGKIQGGSAVAALSSSVPMLFGKGEAFIFDIGEAEYVGEGAQKGASTIVPTSKPVKPFKFHKTLRFNQEVMWANEDRQLEVIDEILALIQPALSRALDFGVFHEINPTGGAVVVAMNGGLTDTTNLVEYVAANKPYVSLDAADDLVMADGFVPATSRSPRCTHPSSRVCAGSPPSRRCTRTSSSAPRCPNWKATVRPCPTRSAEPVSSRSTPNASASWATSAHPLGRSEVHRT